MIKKIWMVVYGEAWAETYATVVAYCPTSALEVAGGLGKNNPKIDCLGLYHCKNEGVEPHVILKCKSLYSSI